MEIWMVQVEITFLEVPLHAEFGWDTRVHSDVEQGEDEDSEVRFESKD